MSRQPPCPRCRGFVTLDRCDGERYCVQCGWRSVTTDDGNELPYNAAFERNGAGYIPGFGAGHGWRKRRGPRSKPDR